MESGKTMGDARPDPGPGVSLPLPAYNSVGQLRADAWNRLEEATGHLLKVTREAERTRLAQQAENLLGLLDPIEHYWASRAGTSSWNYASCSPRASTTSFASSPLASPEPWRRTRTALACPPGSTSL
jgi:hypothetical protein